MQVSRVMNFIFVFSGSYSSSHSQDASPYNAVSLASSPQSSNSYPDLYNTNVGGGFVNQRSPQDQELASNNEDLELEKIVDDVDNMYR